MLSIFVQSAGSCRGSHAKGVLLWRSRTLRGQRLHTGSPRLAISDAAETGASMECSCAACASIYMHTQSCPCAQCPISKCAAVQRPSQGRHQMKKAKCPANQVRNEKRQFWRQHARPRGTQYPTPTRAWHTLVAIAQLHLRRATPSPAMATAGAALPNASKQQPICTLQRYQDTLFHTLYGWLCKSLRMCVCMHTMPQISMC